MQQPHEPAVPPALQGAPREALEEYVASRVRQHVLARGQQLALPTATLQALLGTTGEAGAPAPPPMVPTPGVAVPIASASPPGTNSTSGSGGQHSQAATQALLFFHDCQRLGCADPACELCANNPQRKCGAADFFLPKYFQGAPLTAACGAPLCVSLCGSDNRPAAGGPPGALLEIFLLNNRLYEQEHAGPEVDKLQAAQLLKNAKGTNLLLCGPGGAEQLPNGVLRVSLGGPVAQLPELRVDGSSEGLLGSKLWGYRLAVRVVDAGGRLVSSILPALTPQFIVTTTRVKGNVKPAVPLTTDPVGKLSGIGDRMASKLAHAGEMLAGLEVELPPGGITTVGEFRALVQAVDSQPKLCERVVAALGLQKGWPESRQHALSAVEPDFRLRIWFADPQLASGVLFRAHLGTPQLDHPAAIGYAASGGGLAVTSLEGSGGSSGGSGGSLPGTVQTWHQQAQACWMLPGHPGWGVLGLDWEAFDSALTSGGGSALLPGEMVLPCRQAVAARLSVMPPPEVLLPQASGAALPLSGLPTGRTLPAERQLHQPSPELPSFATAAAAGPPAQAAMGVPPAPAPAGPEGMQMQQEEEEGAGQGEQEPLPSPYDMAMRLPSLPLLGKEPFGSLPKEVQAMESLSRLLFSDASLLPMLGQLAEKKAAAGEQSGGSRGSGSGGTAPGEPSLLLQLLMSLEQHHLAQEGMSPTAAAAAAANAAAEAAAAGSPFEPNILPDQPSWIPTGLFSVLEGEGEAMAVSRSTSKEGAPAGGVGGRCGSGVAQQQGRHQSRQQSYEKLLASMSLDK